ncbi:hypothetical protein OPT61_g2630 [Boeremia exigua]|uniref:Uncharacterized protein n=1 Tax=Boeremia exigua TaxID=749465 RepID=A0ACC2IL66_9PLEO|nr:hypothetical protein OPT61_g2630 [Boeremia exigua]
MHTLSFLVFAIIFSILPRLTLGSSHYDTGKNPDRYHHSRSCVGDRESRDIIERYVSNFETINEASVNATFAEDFTYESDSTSFFMRMDPGTQTIGSRSALITALRADQANGPAFTVTINLYTHTCDSIIFRYRLLGGRVQPSAVGGIDWLFIDLESRKIKSAQSEFNTAAILYNVGALGPPNATSCLNSACEGDGKLIQGCSNRRSRS